MMIKADLHLHTIYSYDATISPRLLVREAITKGFNVIAVTDHNVYDGAIETKRIARSLGDDLIVLLGVELLTDEGEIIILSWEPLERLPRTLIDAIDYARSADATIIVPHPYDRWRNGLGDKLYTIQCDGIEVFNPWTSPKANRRALQAAKEIGCSQIASSDAHSVEYIGLAYTLLNVEDLLEEEIHKAIRKGRCRPVGSYPSMSDRIKGRAKKALRRIGFLKDVYEPKGCYWFYDKFKYF